MSRLIILQHPVKCLTCNLAVTVGSRAFVERGIGGWHEACPTPEGLSRWIEARDSCVILRRAGICNGCRERIERGQHARWVRNVGVWHPDCASLERMTHYIQLASQDLIVVKRTDRCRRCHAFVLQGELARWVKGIGIWHPQCSMDADDLEAMVRSVAERSPRGEPALGESAVRRRQG